MICIDYKDSRPLYEQICDKLSELILCGVFEPDSQLPSVRNLAIELSLNPNTVQKAYADLERKGYIYSVKGKGNFVSEISNLRELKKQEVFNQMDKLLKQGKEFGISSQEFCNRIEQIYEEEKHD